MGKRSTEALTPAERDVDFLIPGIFAMVMLDIASERGLSSASLLAEADIQIAADALIDTGLFVSQHARLMAVVEAALDEPALAVEIGWRLPPTALGSVGYALLASSTMGEVLEILQRFWHLVGRGSSIIVNTKGPVGSIEIDVRLPLPAVARARVAEIIAVSMYRGLLALAPGAESGCEVWFDFPEPEHADAVRHRLPHVRYQMPSCQFRFDTARLDTPLAMSNPVGLRTAMRWCERDEREHGLVDGKLTTVLHQQLRPEGAKGFPSMDQMARRLGMAPRSLRRHLKAEGTSYSSLLQAARLREALRLLEQPHLSVREVASLLGYEDPANFTRAFRSWTGSPPSTYRREAAAKRER